MDRTERVSGALIHWRPTKSFYLKKQTETLQHPDDRLLPRIIKEIIETVHIQQTYLVSLFVVTEYIVCNKPLENLYLCSEAMSFIR